ncbi:MAG: hypothetical protein RL189_43 [Pseudomonadota bacterium]
MDGGLLALPVRNNFQSVSRLRTPAALRGFSASVEVRENKMKFYTSLVCVGLIIGVACKKQSDSTESAASRGSLGDSPLLACQLSDSQVRLIAGSEEFKALETVQVESLPEGERRALNAKRRTPACGGTEISSLAGSFPSIAARLGDADNTDSGATAMALGDTGMGYGMPGVVRTEYIQMSTGSRYVAGYNSDGLMIFLQRLLMRRP